MSAQAIIDAHVAVEVWKQRDQAATEARVKLDAAKLRIGSITLEMQPSGDVSLLATGHGQTLSKENRHAILDWLLADATARGEEIEGLPDAEDAFEGDDSSKPPQASMPMLHETCAIIDAFTATSGEPNGEAAAAAYKELVQLGHRLNEARSEEVEGLEEDAEVGASEGEPFSVDNAEPLAANDEQAEADSSGPVSTLPWHVEKDYEISDSDGDHVTERLDGVLAKGFVCKGDAAYAVACANSMAGRDPSKLKALEEAVSRLFTGRGQTPENIANVRWALNDFLQGGE